MATSAGSGDDGDAAAAEQPKAALRSSTRAPPSAQRLLQR